MIKHFHVENFRNFKSADIDFTSLGKDRGFIFSEKDGILTKYALYGKNNSGKTSIGEAMSDIIHNLTDYGNNLNDPVMKNIYSGSNDISFFLYVFSFDSIEVSYSYEKNSRGIILSENLFCEGKCVVSFSKDKNFYADRNISGELNLDLKPDKISAIKYIYRNRPSGMCGIIEKIIEFCSGMLFISGMKNIHCGFFQEEADCEKMIFNSEGISFFGKILNALGVDFRMCFEFDGFRPVIYVICDDGISEERRIRLRDISSDSIISAMNISAWISQFGNRISFLFIDDFDSVFSFENACEISDLISIGKDFQFFPIFSGKYEISGFIEI